MLSHEMYMRIIANDRISDRLMDAHARRLARSCKPSRPMVTVIGQLVVDIVAILTGFI